MLQAALPNGFRLRMLPRSVPAVFRQTGEIFYIGGTDVLPAPLEGQEEADAIAGLSDPENETARSELIEHNLRLVAHIAKKYTTPKRDADDVISIGVVGLIKAVSTFNSQKGNTLATYAARCIENEILMSLRSEKKQAGEVSLSEPIGMDKDGNEISLSEVLGSDEDEIHNAVELTVAGEYLRKAMDTVLTPRERKVIELRYGLTGGRIVTQREIAKLLRISRSYISRIEKKALHKLNKELGGDKA